MDNAVISVVFYLISLIFLGVRLRTGKKRDFIISVLFIVVGSTWTYFSVAASVMKYFWGAIILSFIGDLLMAQWIRITEHRTVDGAIAFGFAHVVYALGFNQLNYGWFSLMHDWWYLLVGFVLTIGLFQLIGNNPKLHISLKISNFIYSVLIISLFMIVLSLVLSPNTSDLIKFVALGGVLSFMISDGILAYNEFQKPLRHAKEVIAVTYVFAQILLQLVPLLVYFDAK